MTSFPGRVTKWLIYLALSPSSVMSALVASVVIVAANTRRFLIVMFDFPLRSKA
jgi:hypothetical protein